MTQVSTVLPHVEINPQGPADATVIWLHGLGANGHDFEPIVPELRLPESLNVRFIFPHAPEIPVTINAGYVMPAWYDILEMKIDRKVDVDQLLRSAEWVHQFINRERERGIVAQRIIVIGFSQGGAVAYQAALTYPHKLGGLLGLSTYFATSDTINPHVENLSLPIEIHHGRFDPMVAESLGKKAAANLQDRGYQVNYRTYAMEHEVCFDQIEAISLWLQAQLS